MSTPSTLTLPPHNLLDYRQHYLPSPTDRYLPPPRPNSNNNFYQNIPNRPSSNLSSSHFAPPPPRTHSGMSNGAYSHSHAHGQSQARGGAEYSYTNGLTHQNPHDQLRRTNSAASQANRSLPRPQQVQTSRPPQAEPAQPPTFKSDPEGEDNDMERGRKRARRSPVDWVDFFGGRPPAEIITIHDDDSPAPPHDRQLPPPTNNDSSTARHADKRRRTNATAVEPTYSNTNTPYSHSNQTSTESLQNTTAPTSLGSQASTGSRLDTTQTGQKRKRTVTRASDQDRKRQEVSRAGPTGYLAEYGEYQPPPKQLRKQKDVHVQPIHEVSLLQPISAKEWHANIGLRSAIERTTRLMTKTAITLYKKTASWARDTI